MSDPLLPNSADDTRRDQAYERFTALLVASQPAIMGFIRTLLPNASEAEDLLQKTCLVAWQKFDQFDQFDPDTKFTTWACQIAFYEVKNHLRTKARDRHVFSDEVLATLAREVPDESDRLADERRALQHCVKTLGSDERELLRRCYARGAKVTDLAAALNRTANSLYKQLDRIRRRLLVCINARLEEGGAL